jgi:hypothetical protein
MDIRFIYLLLVVFASGILTSLAGWSKAKNPDGTREAWDSRMFFGSMINVFKAAVVVVMANEITWLQGNQITIVSYFLAIVAGAGIDPVLNTVQSAVNPPDTTPIPAATLAKPVIDTKPEPISAGSKLMPPIMPPKPEVK